MLGMTIDDKVSVMRHRVHAHRMAEKIGRQLRQILLAETRNPGSIFDVQLAIDGEWIRNCGAPRVLGNLDAALVELRKTVEDPLRKLIHERWTLGLSQKRVRSRTK